MGQETPLSTLIFCPTRASTQKLAIQLSEWWSANYPKNDDYEVKIPKKK